MLLNILQYAITIDIIIINNNLDCVLKNQQFLTRTDITDFSLLLEKVMSDLLCLPPALMLVFCSPCSSPLKMQATCPSETSVELHGDMSQRNMLLYCILVKGPIFTI
jgi:hypothetical protein